MSRSGWGPSLVCCPQPEAQLHTVARLWDRGVCGDALSLSLSLLHPSRVETYTSENNELWKKVETLETANR